MVDKQFLHLNENWALAYDRLQWILQRRGSYDTRRRLHNWQPVAYVATRRDILMRIIRENGVEPNADAKITLENLPDTFGAWITDHTQNPSRFLGADSAMSGSGLPSTTKIEIAPTPRLRFKQKIGERP
jgi:hypothetical protein